MGSGYSTPAKKDAPHTLGLKPKRTNDAESGKVLPWFCGQQRLGLTWLGPAYNVRTEGIQNEDSGSKGGGDDDQVTAYDYFADCAGIVCHGPVDVLREVWMDQERVWRGALVRDAIHPNTASVDIEGRGTLHIYWGAETQNAHPVLAANGHPAYRGQCVVFFEQLYFGRDKTNAPDVELVLERSPLNYTGAVALGGTKRLGYDASLIHALVELLSHPRCGFGFAAADFDLPSLAASASKLLGEGIAASPLFDEQETAAGVVERFCEYCGGWPSFRDGSRLQILLAREPSGSTTAYPLIGEFDLVRPPRYDQESMRETVNKVIVKFTDWRRYFEPDTEGWVDAGNYAQTGRWAVQTLDRSWVTVRNIALRLGRRHARLASVPLIYCDIEVRRDLVDDELMRRADEIAVGSFVRFTYANYAQTLLMRVVKKSVPSDRSQAVHLWLESDLYQDAVLGYTADDVPGPDDDLDVDAGGAAEWEIVELPPALVSDDAGAQNLSLPWFGVFASRASAMDTRLAVYAAADGATFKRVALQRQGVWAVFGELEVAVDEATNFLFVVRVPAGQADFRPPLGAPGDVAAMWRGDNLLYIEGEWLSYDSATIAVDGDTYLVTLANVVRCRFGAGMAIHLAGARCWMIAKKKLKAYTNAGFRLGADASDNDVWFKVTTGTKTTWFPVGDVTPRVTNVKGATVQPCPPANLRMAALGDPAQPATAAFTWNTANTLPLDFPGALAIYWTDRAWQRHAFYAAWSKPYRGIQSYVVTIRPLGWAEDDAELSVVVDDIALPSGTVFATPQGGITEPGNYLFAVTAADITAALGSLPDVMSVSVVAVWRGIESLPVTSWIIVAGTAGSDPGVDAAQPMQWMPSGLHRLAYAADPERACNFNFQAINAHWSLTFGGSVMQSVLGVKPKTARARIVLNFSRVQLWVRANLNPSFTLHTVTGPEPEWAIDENFRLINSIW